MSYLDPIMSPHLLLFNYFPEMMAFRRQGRNESGAMRTPRERQQYP
jgi:hypothetical protein